MFVYIQPLGFSLHQIRQHHSMFFLLVQYGQSYKVEAVSPELQQLLLFALDDPVKRVQLAAAVCQYAIGTHNAHARDILRKTLQCGKHC